MRISIFVTSFIAIFTLVASFLYNNWQQMEAEHLAQDTAVLATTSRASIRMFNLTTDLIYSNFSSNPRVIDTFARGVKASGAERDALREELYQLILPIYRLLEAKGIVLLHFHTAESESFLRFHLPDKHGDSLADIRPSLRIANSEQRIVTGFELGRVKSGFRYVYPFFQNGTHIGSVEISLGFDEVRNSMSAIDEERHYDLILKRDKVFKVLFDKWRTSYPDSVLSKHYILDGVFGLQQEGAKKKFNDIEKLKSTLSQDTVVQERLQSQRAFSHHVKLEGNEWVVSFAPLHDVQDEHVGYFVSYAESHTLTDFEFQFYTNLIFSFLAIGLVLVLVWFLLRSRDRSHNEKKHLATITNTIGDGVYVMGPGGVITEVNDSFTEILGYEAGDVVGLVGHDLFHAHDEGRKQVPIDECPIYSSTVKGNEYRGEEYFRHKDGHLIQVEATSRPFREGTAQRGSVTAFRDITARKHAEHEQKRLERELQQAHKMESLGSLTGGIAHDFNNLLGVIAGYTKLTLNMYQDKEDNKIVEYMTHVAGAAKRATELVSQMLSFSRITDSDSSILELSPLLQEDLTLIRATLPATIDIDTEIEDNLPSVKMNSTQLHQVLMNLSVNARDAMNGVGRLNIRLKWAKNVNTESSISHRPIKGDWVELSVRDSGCGIDDKTAEHIFDPFFTTKEVGKGTGMGLAVVYSIMEQNGGHILLDTKVGEGSTFRLLFAPSDVDVVVSDAEPGVAEQPALESGGEPIEIMVVDDEVALGIFMTEILRSHGYQATSYSDSGEALEAFTQEPERFDLIITDQTMPIMTGTELGKKIRTIRPETPVIVCSGYSDELNVTVLKENRVEFFTKPVDDEALLKKIAEIESHLRNK